MGKELIGQFLVRRGKVKHQDIEDALVLQGLLNDSLGAVALAHDWISFQDVAQILEYLDRHSIGFSEAAIKLKILTEKQVQNIKDHYSERRIYIGELLVATGRISRKELEEELEVFSQERKLVPSPNLTKARLVSQVARRTGQKRDLVARTVDSVFQALKNSLAKGETVELKGFGSFHIKKYPARLARNPRTGKEIKIKPRKVPKLRFSKKMRHSVDPGKPI